MQCGAAAHAPRAAPCRYVPIQFTQLKLLACDGLPLPL